MTDRKMCKFYNLNVPDRRSVDTGNQNNDEDDRNPETPLEPYVPPHHHKLEYCYWMWFSRRPPARELSTTTTGYGQALRMVGRMASVEQWWGLYMHMLRPSELPPLSDLHLFKLGIKPMWEDPANVNGGKWVVRLRKTQTGRAWEDLCMALLGEQFLVDDEMCGIVLSVRFQEDHLAVWHRTAADAVVVGRVHDTLRRVLQLPASHPLDYKVHRDCLRASHSAAYPALHAATNHAPAPAASAPASAPPALASSPTGSAPSPVPTPPGLAPAPVPTPPGLAPAPALAGTLPHSAGAALTAPAPAPAPPLPADEVPAPASDKRS